MNRHRLFLLVIFLSLSITNGFPVEQDLSDQSVVYSGSVTDSISQFIVPPYRTAYTTLNDDIVQPLLSADTESDQETVEHLIESLVQAAKKVRNLLHTATNASELIRNAVDKQVLQLVLIVTIRESQVRRSQAAVTQAMLNIQHTQHQVNIAESAARDAENSLNSANHELHEAEKAVERARRCGIGRRKKRFLDKVFQALNPINIVDHVVLRPICSVVNSGGIDRAKDRRSMAWQTLHNARDRVQNHRQALSNYQTQLNSAHMEHASANQALQSMRSTLNELRAKQSLVTSFTSKIKNVEVHLNTVLGRSRVLASDTANLIDFELVIEPLNNIYEEMIDNKIMQSFDFEITAETARQINENLQKLTAKMSKMPLNVILDENFTEITDDSTDPSRTDSGEGHGFENDSEVTEPSKTDSEEIYDDNTDPPETDSGEAHGYDTVSDTTERSKTDSEETSDQNIISEEVTNAPETNSEEIDEYDTVDTTIEPSTDGDTDSTTTDSEEVTNTPSLDSAETTDDPIEGEAVNESQEHQSDATTTDSEENHDEDTITEVTDAPVLDSAETVDDGNVDEEVSDQDLMI